MSSSRSTLSDLGSARVRKSIKRYQEAVAQLQLPKTVPWLT